MLFAFLCTDKPNSLQVRMDARPEHVAWLNGLNDAGTLKFAGPFLDAESKPNGSLVVVKAETIEDAQALSAADPYAKAGLFASVDIKPWNWVFNNPEA
ncbi:YciI-like protein [Pararhizobium sp.]|uniref:YciI-like protein n=1 Tax=Pararhizobium sp. TaxID=1977563 RepID=UPI00271D8154|nr:YciI-like protein [Pararhizobium sp.]MDO9416533.1 YciI-like protein [Pararhizobium sp.]